jgi:hypothetical protein
LSSPEFDEYLTVDIKEGGLGTETNSEDGTETNAEERHVFCLQHMCGLFCPKLSQISSSIRLAFLSSALKTLSYCMHPTYEERESEREREREREGRKEKESFVCSKPVSLSKME